MYGNSDLEFEWDLQKNILNIEKHGISFERAVEAFFDPSGFSLEDISHSIEEERFYWLGKDKLGVVITVRYTRRARTIRIFGAASWRRFRRIYYETTKSW